MPTPLSLNNSVIWLIESDSQYDTAPETFVEEDLTDEYPDPEVEGLIRAFRASDMFKRPPGECRQPYLFFFSNLKLLQFNQRRLRARLASAAVLSMLYCNQMGLNTLRQTGLSP